MSNVTYLPTALTRVPAGRRDAASEPRKSGLTEEPSARRSVKPPPSQPLEDAAEAVVGARRAATSAPPTRAVFSGAMLSGHDVGAKCHALISMSRYQRTHDGAEQKTTTLELFYDLVFVFAITQVSHFLLEHLTWEGAGQATLMLLVVWWSWNYTTWVTNELDPESIVVRMLLIGLMLASFLMAVAIPEAFGERALLFAGSYVVIQVGRHTFLTFVAAGAGSVERERAGRILIWFVAAGTLWIAGALAEGSTRTLLWLIALAIDYAGPICTFYVPGMRKIDPSAWAIETGHFAERFQLFVILALGESIVVTGATATGEALDAARLAAFSVAFLGTAAMWWLYFDYAAAISARRLELAANRTQMARDAYTYLHVVMVAGVIVSAVG